MERFAADLHVHSRFSRATSKELTIRSLAAWARVKGLTVLGTGDFTHPGWLTEIEETLQEDGSGLLVLKDATGLEALVPGVAALPPGVTRFMLQAEISSIYKKAGKVRKIHNLVYLPSLEAVRAFNRKLEQLGNLKSDGRPILGLDSRDLLAMVLDTHPQGFVVPAHIWTPWFALFGSKSGFNSIEACFEDLSGEIFAMETGLSSDPEMNWRWSALDRVRLISNSDAHSGEKLGRECNLFRGEISYEGIYRALRGEGLGQKFLGTVEFFPEEGKYHLDGHRKCNVVMEPEETRQRRGVCPVCGKPVTLGVLSRVRELADREQPIQPQNAPGFTSLIPLKELLGEILDAGPATKKVHELYLKLLGDFGTELNVLTKASPEDLKLRSPLLAEGVARMREGKVLRAPGYDGEYGVISVFSEAERREFRHGGRLVQTPAKKRKNPTPEAAPLPEAPAEAAPDLAFNEAQQRAIAAGPGPVLVLAGPGTGKTQTLMGRIDRLLNEGENPRRILALTFTRRAARELKERLLKLLGLADEEAAPLPQAGTLHAHGYDYWKFVHGEAPVVLDDASARRIFLEANPGLNDARGTQAFERYNLARETLAPLPGDLAEAGARYARQKDSWNQADYADLLEFQLQQFQAPTFVSPYAHVLVDEIQDLTPLQLAVVTALAGTEGRGFFAIGDPNQSIYGFRGAVGAVRAELSARWPQLTEIALTDNYRSGQPVLDCAHALFPDSPRLAARRDAPCAIHLFRAPDAPLEAAWLAERIKNLLGPTSHSLADGQDEGGLAPGDIAVLVRFRGLIPALEAALGRFGVPCAAPEAEAFWNEPRVSAILGSVGRALGMACAFEGDCPDLPEAVLTQGPDGLAKLLKDTPPFDPFFWQSRPFRELREAHGRRGGWAGLINWVHLQSELENVRRSAEKVQIMSIHAAKGLEFEAVFLPALEDGILPFAGADMLTGKITAPENLPDTAEERRLLYVGLTRARRSLYLSHAAQRALYGRTLRLPPSRFLKDLPEALMTRSQLAAHTVKKEKQMTLFD